MRWSGALAAAAVLVAATGCSGDDDAGAGVTTEAESTTTTTAPETTAPPTTPAPSTTPPTAVADTTTSTTSPTTTTAPTTAAGDDYAAQAIAVIDRTEESWGVVLIAFRDPFNEGKAAALDDYFTGNQLEGFDNLLEEFRDGNFRSVPRPDMPEVYVVDPRSLTLSPADGFATVQVCHIDTSLIVETAGNADGTDRVVSDEVEQEIVELDVVRLDGVWKVESARAPETEIAECP